MNIFFNITDKEKVKLLTYLKAHYYHASSGKNISFIVNDLNSLCIIEKGEVKITKTDDSGNEILIETLSDKDVFGCTISNLNTDKIVETTMDTDILIMDFKYVINKNDKYTYYHQFIKNLLMIYEEKIEKKNDRIEVLINKSIRDKLLSFFSLMVKGKNTKIIYLPFSFTSLADFLAVNRSAMSREITNLKVEGFIEVQGRKIKLLY